MTNHTTSKGTRIVGDHRLALVTQLAEEYRAGASIRQLAQQNGRGYGTIHRLLTEAGVTLRGRGGLHPQPST
jgi:predicted transcriptional regulator